MRVAIVGSRNLKVDISEFIPIEATEIISGGARGIDSLAEAYADKRKMPKLIIRPDYARDGKIAPLKRNKTIVDAADMVVAVWDGRSYGTKYVINYAKKIGKRIQVYVVK